MSEYSVDFVSTSKGTTTEKFPTNFPKNKDLYIRADQHDYGQDYLLIYPDSGRPQKVGEVPKTKEYYLFSKVIVMERQRPDTVKEDAALQLAEIESNLKATQKARTELGWNLPADIQQEGIPAILGGADVCMAAETGTGKTGAFCLPVL